MGVAIHLHVVHAPVRKGLGVELLVVGRGRVAAAGRRGPGSVDWVYHYK